MNANHTAVINFLKERHPNEKASVKPESHRAIEAAELFMDDAGHGKFTGTVDQLQAYFEAIEAINVSTWANGSI